MVKDIKILGHKGDQGLEVECSYDAIMNCSISKDIDGVELSIRPTLDDKIVVMNDSTIDGYKVQNLTLSDLKKMQFKTKSIDVFLQRLFNLANIDRYFFNRYGCLSKQHCNIEKIERILKDFSKDKHMLIELKCSLQEYSELKQKKFEQNVIEILQQYDYKNRNLAIQSYNYDALFRIKDKLPDLNVVALINKSSNFNTLDMGFDGANIKYNLINENAIGRIIKNRMSLYSWDDKTPVSHYKKVNLISKEYENEIKNGELPFYVITDFPCKVKQYVKK